MNCSPKVITINNNKGGVGKSTLATNLGAALAKLDYKVCLIDLDTQGNLTMNLLKQYNADIQPGIISALLDPDRGIKPTEVMYESVIENLYVIPNEVKINGMPIAISNELEKEMDRGEVLKKLLMSDLDINFLDYIIIDTPPTNDLVVANALIASDYYLIPTITADGSINGLFPCMEYANRFKKHNKSLELLGVALLAADNRLKKTKNIKEELSNGLNDKFFESVIPTNAVFDDLINQKKTIFDVDKKKSKGAKEYLNLAKEVVLKSNELNIESNIPAHGGA